MIPCSKVSSQLSLLAAEAVVPEQLPCYVQAVGMSEACPCSVGEPFVFYLAGERAILVAYPGFEREKEFLTPERYSSLLAKALAEIPQETRFLTLLSPLPTETLPLPSGLRATPESPFRSEADDWYWTVPLPCTPPSDKVRNMLRRAAQEVDTAPEPWGPEAASLAAFYCRTRHLTEGSRFIYGRMEEYLSSCSEALLLGARRRSDGSLAACAVGDFTALGTAFYMFAFRRPDAPPGCADALLAALMEEGVRRGHGCMNLGLGIRPGIEFFKKKWRAQRGLPYYERTWRISPIRRGILSRLFGG